MWHAHKCLAKAKNSIALSLSAAFVELIWRSVILVQAISMPRYFARLPQYKQYGDNELKIILTKLYRVKAFRFNSKPIILLKLQFPLTEFSMWANNDSHWINAVWSKKKKKTKTAYNCIIQ